MTAQTFLETLSTFFLRVVSGRAFRELVIVTIGSAAGAWAGGRAAFASQTKREDRKRDDEQFGAGKFAQFVLVSHFSFLGNVWKQWLEPRKDSPGRWAELRSAPMDRDPLSVDAESLGVVLDRDPNLLAVITEANIRFFLIMDRIRWYSEAHAEFQRRMDEEKIKGDIEGSELIGKIGMSLYARLRDFSDQLYEDVPKEFGHNRYLAEKLGEFLKQQYPQPKHFWQRRQRRRYLDFEMLKEKTSGEPTGTSREEG